MAESKEEQINAVQAILDSEEELTKISDSIFEKNDLDNTGFIERGEFVNIINAFTESMGITTPSDSDINGIISALDYNNDAKFNRSEFTDFIRMLLESILQALKK